MAEWIEETDGRATWWKCSECKRSLLIKYKHYRPKFCPECGAKMENPSGAYEHEKED